MSKANKATNVISNSDFAKVQTMAHLSLTDSEKDLIHGQLDEALKAVKVFDELDLSDIPPLSHPTELTNVLRDDVVTPSFSQEQALQNAPTSHAGYVMVPGVFEEQS